MRRYEARGWLHPSGGKGEERLFDATEAKALARLVGKRATTTAAEHTGAADAAAFRMFRTGATHEEVVIALELTADRVRELFALWRAGYGTIASEDDDRSAAADADFNDDRVFREWAREMAAHVADDNWSERHNENRRLRVSPRRELAAALGFSDRPARRE